MKRIIQCVLIFLLIGCTNKSTIDNNEPTLDQDVVLENNDNEVEETNDIKEPETIQVDDNFYETESILLHQNEHRSHVIKGDDEFFYLVIEKPLEFQEVGQLPNPSSEVYKVDIETHEQTLVKEMREKQTILDIENYQGIDYAIVLAHPQEDDVTIKVIKDFFTENETTIDEYPYIFYSTNIFRNYNDKLYYFRLSDELAFSLIHIDGQQADDDYTEEPSKIIRYDWVEDIISQDNQLIMVVYRQEDSSDYTLKAYFNDDVIEKKLPHEPSRFYSFKDRVLITTDEEENMTEARWLDLATTEILPADVNYQIDGYRIESLTNDLAIVYEYGKKFDMVYVNDDYQFEVTEVPELLYTSNVTKLSDSKLLLDMKNNEYLILTLNH